jgi:cytochrome c-type biogenesis protein CcmH/NrfF
MQSQGESETQILADFKQHGGALMNFPGFIGKSGPYIALVVGFAFVVLTIRRYRLSKSSSESDPSTLAAVEKHLAGLDL